MAKNKLVISEGLEKKYGHLENTDIKDARVLPEDEGKVFIKKYDEDKKQPTIVVQKLLTEAADGKEEEGTTK